MKHWNISNYKDLCNQIQIEEAKRLVHLSEMKEAFIEFKDSINPLHLAKEAYKELAVQEEIKAEAKSIGLNILGNLLIGGLLKRGTVAGFIGATLLENIPSSVLAGVIPKVRTVLSSLFSRKSKVPIIKI